MIFIEFDNHLRASYSFAVEEYIMNNSDFSDEYFLFWRTKPCLMIGRFQNTIQEINIDFAKENDIEIVRRNSGGGTVYTDENCWQFSFITWKETNKPKDFRDFTKPVIEALRKLGIPAEFSGRNDLYCNGKKFSGNAQFTIKNRFLHHGTILFDTKLENLVNSITVSNEKIISKGIKSIKERVTNIRPFLIKDTNSISFKNDIVSLIKGDMKQAYLTEQDICEIKKIEKEKFLSWDWNYGNSPSFNITKSNRFQGGKVEVQLNVKNGIIQTCSIFGDFFSKDDINIINNAVVGCKYKSENIKDVLKKVKADKIIYRINIDELLSCFIN